MIMKNHKETFLVLNLILKLRFRVSVLLFIRNFHYFGCVYGISVIKDLIPKIRGVNPKILVDYPRVFTSNQVLTFYPQVEDPRHSSTPLIP